MKLSDFRYAATFAFFLLLAAPAFAQFEVNPDHFDGPPADKTTVNAASKKNAGANSSNQAAGRKPNAARKIGAPSVASNPRKPHPGRKAANNSVLAAKNNSAAPSVRTQASTLHRE